MSTENENKEKAAYDQIVAQIKNRAYVKAYLAFSDIITQKEFCKRMGFTESRFSRLVSKLEPTL